MQQGKAELKGKYEVGEICALLGEPPERRDAVRRMLQRAGLYHQVGGRGTKGYVWLSELKRRLPELWESILDREAARSVA